MGRFTNLVNGTAPAPTPASAPVKAVAPAKKYEAKKPTPAPVEKSEKE